MYPTEINSGMQHLSSPYDGSGREYARALPCRCDAMLASELQNSKTKRRMIADSVASNTRDNEAYVKIYTRNDSVISRQHGTISSDPSTHKLSRRGKPTLFDLTRRVAKTGQHNSCHQGTSIYPPLLNGYASVIARDLGRDHNNELEVDHSSPQLSIREIVES